MSTAELDTKRRSLGLSVPEAAEVLGVGVRTAGYWFAGDGEPRRPEEVVARLQEIEVTMGDLVDDLVEQANDAADRGVITLLRFRNKEQLDASGLARGLPLGAYSMAISWALEDLRADGHEVTVAWGG